MVDVKGIDLILGDCLDVMSSIPDHSVDLVLVDPPHGRTECTWDTAIPFEPLWEHYRRIIKPDGTVVVMSTQPFTSRLVVSNEEWYRYSWVWEKSKAPGWLNSKRRPMPAHEDLVVFSPKAPRYFPLMREGQPYDKGLTKAQSDDDLYGRYERVVVKSEDGTRYPRSVVYFPTAESEGKTYHKTQKPVKLLSYMIQTYTRPGEMVLDNCMGSGSTGVACLKTGRPFIGIERDPDIYEAARSRVYESAH